MKQVTAERPAKKRRSAKEERIPDIRKLETIPILKRGESWITVNEALRRARENSITNHGERFAMKLAADLNVGRVSCKNWHVGQYVVFAKDSLRRDDYSYAWYVVRDQDGFYCRSHWFTDQVYSNGRRYRFISGGFFGGR